jgi:hypothetical protein
MRNITPALLSLWESGSFGIEVDCLIEVPTSPTETVLRSYRAYLGQNWLASLDFSESIDQTIAAGTLVLIREHGDVSLSPLVETSPANGYGTGFYAPAIDSGREIEIRVALVPQVQYATAPSGAPAGSTALTVSPLPFAAPKGATVLLGGTVATVLAEPADKSATFLSIVSLAASVAAGASVQINAALPDATYDPAVTIYDVGNWIPVLLGTTDKPDWGGKANEVKVNFRNRLGVLADKQILDAFDVGLPEVLTPVEDVIQQIINARAPGTFSSVVPLPSSPGFDIRYGPVEPQLVFEAIESLLAQYGGRVQFKQPAGYGDYELCIVLPPDEPGDPQYTIAPTQYIDVPVVELDPAQRRTVIRVAYMDKETGALSYYQHPPEELVESDPIVQKYGDLRMQLAFGAAHAIDTEAEARTLAEKAHAALSTVPLAQEVECFTAPWVELDDIVTLPANGFHYDTDQIGAVTGISWSFPRGGGGRMRIRCSEKPLGGFKRYQQMDAQIYGFNASQREPVPSIPLPALENFGPKEKTALGVTPSWTRSLLPPVAQVWVYSFEVDVPFAVKPAPDETTARTAVLVTENEYFIAYPPKGKEKFVYFVPVTSVGTMGVAKVSHVLPASGFPLVSFNSVQGSSELYSDVLITVEDPQNLGGTLRVWLNRDEPGDASTSGTHEALLTLAETPGSVGAGALFLTVPGGALEAVLDDVRTHPNLGKIIFAEFVNTLGVSSGIQKGYLKGWGTIVDGSGNLKPGAITIADQISDALLTTAHFAAGIRPYEIVSSLPATGNVEGRIVFLTTDGKIYRYTVGVWTRTVPAADLSGLVTGAQIEDGALSTAKFAAGVRPVELVETLPATGNVQGRVVFLTADNKLYRWTGSSWSAAIPAADVTGQITGTQITDGAVSSPKIAAGAVTAGKVAALSITSAEIAADAIIAGKVAAGAISTTELAADAITSAKIAAGAVTAGKIAALSITSAEIAANTITGNKIAANTITGDRLVANTISAGQIQAGAIGTTELAAQSVVASKLLVSNFFNLAENGSFQTGTTLSWEGSGLNHLSVVASAGHFVSTYAGLFAPTTDTEYISPCKVIVVQPGDAYRLSMAAYRNTANYAIYLGVLFYRADGSFIAGAVAANYFDGIATTQRDGGIVTAPADAAQMIVSVVSYSATPTGAWMLSEVAVRSATTGQLIVDGEVTALKLSTDAIWSKLIATGLVGNTLVDPTSVIRFSTAAAIPASAVSYLDLAATGTGPVLFHDAITLRADGDGEFRGTLSVASGLLTNAAVSPTAAVRLDSSTTMPLSAVRFLDLGATGSAPFLKHDNLALNADGSSVYKGEMELYAGLNAIKFYSGSTQIYSLGALSGGGVEGLRFTPVGTTLPSGASVGFLRDTTSTRAVLDIFADLSHGGGRLGFFGIAPIDRPTITGSTAGNAALQSIAAAGAALGLWTNSTT